MAEAFRQFPNARVYLGLFSDRSLQNTVRQLACCEQVLALQVRDQSPRPVAQFSFRAFVDGWRREAVAREDCCQVPLGCVALRVVVGGALVLSQQRTYCDERRGEVEQGGGQVRRVSLFLLAGRAEELIRGFA